jgi:hypothetical protein
MNKSDLRLAWCDYSAAKYAVEHWHYSKSMPASKCVKIGIWESGKFIGAVIFSWGANNHIGSPYGLKQTEVCELVRVALMPCHAMPVSRIVSLALKMLLKQSPGLRLIVSYADPEHKHHGGIYQAMNWVYTGLTGSKYDFVLDGRKLQRRSYTGVNYGRAKLVLPVGAEKQPSMSKHRYLYPLDSAMRSQIEPLRKSYPKRGTGEIDNAPRPNVETGGARPTVPLSKELEHD